MGRRHYSVVDERSRVAAGGRDGQRETLAES